MHAQIGDIDLKLGHQYGIPAPFRSELLFEERFTCVVRRDHPLRSARPTLKQFAGTLPPRRRAGGAAGSEARGFVDDILAPQGIQRRVAPTVSHFLVAPHIVASSDLALVVSERVIAPYPAPSCLPTLILPVRPIGYRLSQLWAQRSEDDDGHRWLRNTLATLAHA
jgi:DNA-binding transcriptional LysR family regulator